MDKPKITPKDFFLWAGAMVALYWSVIAFIFLFFNYIDYTFQNGLNYLSANPYDSGIGYEMASVIVMFPIYAVLMWLIRRDIVSDASRSDIWVRKWALILTLFVAGVTIAGDLIFLLTAFLSGQEITLAFLLKALVLFLVASAAFMHFIADYWGYWEKYPSRRRSVCYMVGLLALLTIAAGFLMFGSPYSAREYRLDAQRVSDLTMLQSELTDFYQLKRALPNTLGQLNDPLLYNSVPTDPGTGQPYEYRKVADLGFELCAVFAGESRGSAVVRAQPVYVGGKMQQDNWSHGAGRTCFVRSIDPALFPPLTK